MLYWPPPTRDPPTPVVRSTALPPTTRSTPHDDPHPARPGLLGDARGGRRRSGLRRPGRAGAGAAVPGLPLRAGPEGEARPLAPLGDPGRRGRGGGDRPRRPGRQPALGAGRGGGDAAEVAPPGCGEGRAPRLDRRRGTLGHRPDRPLPGHDPPPCRPRLVVPPAGPSAGRARGQGGRVGPHARRRLHSQDARSQPARPRARGRPEGAHPPPLLRPDGPAADARGG